MNLKLLTSVKKAASKHHYGIHSDFIHPLVKSQRDKPIWWPCLIFPLAVELITKCIRISEQTDTMGGRTRWTDKVKYENQTRHVKEQLPIGRSRLGVVNYHGKYATNNGTIRNSNMFSAKCINSE
jgi:hypothetical protein